jgi:hypothetical protein
MVHQVAEKLTVADVRDFSPKNYSAFEGGVQGSGVSEDTSKFNHNNDTPKQELYVQILDEVLDQILKHGLSNAESRIFVYFLKLDRFGDRPAKVKVAEVLLATGVSKSAYHLAMAKFERMGWFGFKYGELEVSNFCTPKKMSKKMDSRPEKWTVIPKNGQSSQKMDSQSKKMDIEEPKGLPDKVFSTPQTIQTYSNLLHTLSEEQRESFKKFCLKKIQECSFKIGSKEAWLNKHGAEYLEEFKETYSYALANPEVIAPKATYIDIPDIPQLKRAYGERWKDAAIHYGLIDPNSPEQEIQDELEPVGFLEEAEKPLVDSDNPQEPTPPSPAISSKHRKFAKGNTVVIAEPGNIHKGEKGKVIFTSYGSQEDEYRIALDKESHSVREVTIKIPKPCKFTYLTLFSQLQT